MRWPRMVYYLGFLKVHGQGPRVPDVMQAGLLSYHNDMNLSSGSLARNYEKQTCINGPPAGA